MLIVLDAIPVLSVDSIALVRLEVG
jgi:hypothetical protein